MHVSIIDTYSQATEFADEWHHLANGHPFRSSRWLLPWWESFGSDNDLFLVVVRGVDDRLLALAPWYRTPGRTLRCLGDGPVCTDHSSILVVDSEDRRPILRAISEQLLGLSDSAQFGWNTIVLECIPEADLNVRRLAIELEQEHAQVYVEKVEQLWQLNLSGGWEAYLKSLSKNSRKNMRRLDKKMDQVDVRWIQEPAKVSGFLDQLVELHQRRWVEKGEDGCFADSRFEAFLRSTANQFSETSATRFLVIEHGGEIVSADFALAGREAIYCYQAGVDPAAMEIEAGKIANVQLMQRACRDGIPLVDFLRGNEPYKAQFRAEPQWLVNYRIAAPKLSARMNHGIWVASRSAKIWAKQWLGHPQASGG
jgi:CelD/BcsL family acetyltransferase involved in cellulose biosynthesis